MNIAYALHSKRAALLLDDGGVCRWFVAREDGVNEAEIRRCMGAQFVASLDPEEAGLLAPTPRMGKRALFARVDGGRVVLVRFGPIVAFHVIDPAPAAERPRERALRVVGPPRPPTAAPCPVYASPDPTLRPNRRRSRPSLPDFDELRTDVDLNAHRTAGS